MPCDAFAEPTYSLCPVCLKRLPAMRVERGDAICLERTCDEHGFFSAPIWRNRFDFRAWTKGAFRIGDEGNPDCPTACGLCRSHARDTCCVLLEVARKCDLDSCRFCFADSRHEPEPPREQISEWLRRLVRQGETFLQLSGGEPATRDDLPGIVAEASALGCRYIQLNSNGIRLSSDPDYVRALAESGLSFVFLQFDGADDGVYRCLRGRELMSVKEKAIENCARFNIGVTLVPTVVRGINADRLGDIVRFGVARSPAVRGVHFQPVCYLGKVPAGISDSGRLTLDEVVEGIYAQTKGLLKGGELRPSGCDHPLCGFHGAFVVRENGALYALNRGEAQEGDCCRDASLRNREFVGRRWKRPAPACCCHDDGAERKDMGNMDYFLARAASHAFTISGMAFQDAGNMDLERLASCSLHVFRDGAMIPFCAYYLAPLEM